MSKRFDWQNIITHGLFATSLPFLFIPPLGMFAYCNAGFIFSVGPVALTLIFVALVQFVVWHTALGVVVGYYLIAFFIGALVELRKQQHDNLRLNM